MDNRENINWNEEIDQLREQVRSQEARIAALEAELAGMRQTAPQPQAAPPNWQQMPPQQAPPNWQQRQGQPPQPQRWPKPPKPKQKLSETIYPASILALCAAGKSNEPKEQARRNAIPEFMRFNIVESEVRNVI